MRTTRHEPWGPGAGLVFVVLLAAGLCLLSLPGGESVAHRITSVYAGEGEQAQLIFGSYLLATAALFFYWAIEMPSGQFAPADSAGSRATDFAIGVAFAALLFAAGTKQTSVAAGIT